MSQIEVPMVLQRSRRRSLAIHVFADRVEIRAPLRMAQREIATFVQEKQPWVERKLAEARQRVVHCFRPLDGADVQLMGEPWRICWRDNESTGSLLEGDRLVLCAPMMDEQLAARLFRDWLLSYAATCLTPRARDLAGTLGLEARCSGFRYRYTRSLWGRCSARGEILFNPLIVLAPMAVIDYLVAHEVCHLRHLNHSPAFWALVETACPDWRAARAWLRRHGHGLQMGA